MSSSVLGWANIMTLSRKTLVTMFRMAKLKRVMNPRKAQPSTHPVTHMLVRYGPQSSPPEAAMNSDSMPMWTERNADTSTSNASGSEALGLSLARSPRKDPSLCTENMDARHNMKSSIIMDQNIDMTQPIKQSSIKRSSLEKRKTRTRRNILATFKMRRALKYCKAIPLPAKLVARILPVALVTVKKSQQFHFQSPLQKKNNLCTTILSTSSNRKATQKQMSAASIQEFMPSGWSIT
mmetsp:Transcript_39121/g.108825  ORF Transcript_39121/g.108825 Transcript_39121/m.108825 type:complete len:237 (-) Transcript_39121:486-1196(-)